MYDQPSLYDALKASYGNEKSQNTLSKFGLKKDPELSNGNESVFVDPIKHKILYSIAGTHNLSDVMSDVWLAGGHLKDTIRFKEADRILKEAKQKYKGYDTTVTGHSLGGAIAQYVGGENDHIITYNKGVTIGQPNRKNEVSLRTKGDLVSILGSYNNGTNNIENHNPYSGNMVSDVLRAHNLSNIQKEKIFI
jgi:hypothetical protein